VLVAPHAAAQLVKVAEPEAVGAVNDNGVGVGNIQAALDDGGGKQHVGLAVDEPGHDFLQVVAAQLAVADDDAGLGQQGLEPGGHGVDGQHAVVEKEYLAAAIQLALDGLADEALVVGGDDGLDGQAVVRGRLDGAQVARAGERQVKRAGDGRGAEGEHVHQVAEHFELLLVHHAEALLLVNDHQPEVFEADVFLQQPVGADDDVHRAGGEAADGLLLGAAGAEAGEQFKADGIIGHALAEGVEVLLRQHGGGHQHGDLLAAHDRFERGADANFGFAEADIAADEPVHGLGALQVGFGFGDGARLVGRFLEEEGALELALPGNVAREGVAGQGLAGGLDGEQVAGDIPHSLFGPGLGVGPARAAQRVERRARFARADVFADQVRFGDRHEQPGRLLAGLVRRIFKNQAFRAGARGHAGAVDRPGAGARRRNLQTEVAANAVLDVNHVVALLQLGEINVQRRPGRLGVGRLEPARPLHLVAAENLGVRDHRQPGVVAQKAAGERA